MNPFKGNIFGCFNLEHIRSSRITLYKTRSVCLLFRIWQADLCGFVQVAIREKADHFFGNDCSIDEASNEDVGATSIESLNHLSCHFASQI